MKSPLFFRYPNPFLQQPPPSPLETQLKSQLPGGLGHDPRCWHREDVSIFLRYCEREFDLEQIDLEKFQMNGKFIIFIYFFIAYSIIFFTIAFVKSLNYKVSFFCRVNS